MKKRSALVWSERAFTLVDDDWMLIDEAGIRLTRILRVGVADDGPWRWRVYRANGPGYIGSAESRRGD